MSDFIAFLNNCARRRLDHPTERRGQAYFNTLHEMRPDLSEQVRATHLDPFYQDEAIEVFLGFVGANW
jgi:hypothetical protein